MALFFAMHYGIFHLAYMAFIFSFGKIDFVSLKLFGAIFFANHLFSYKSNKENDRKRVLNIGTMMINHI